MDVREKLVELLRTAHNKVAGVALEDDEKTYSNAVEMEADELISNGVTVQEWISVKERLPNENEHVMIWDGKWQIAKIEKGISEKERELMKNGEIDDPVEIGWDMSNGYIELKRSELYKACDEVWNNNVPYCWYVNGGMMNLFGQNVTYWMPLPQPPKGE